MNLPKSYKDFLESLQYDSPPEMWPEGLKAMWWDACGDWDASHNIAQEMPSKTGHWIHAYLHRKEGDKWNAGYWYQRAGLDFPAISLEEEFKEVVLSILEI